jgi:fibronectin type 3 domain-containing protein
MAIVEALECRRLLASVVTYHNDNASSGVNPNETLLTPTSVNVNTFGKQFSTPVDGQVYGQPLYVPAINITSGPQPGVHNVIFAVTQHDSLYAIDAVGGNVLWKTSFINSADPKVNLLGATSIGTMPATETNSSDITPEIGITATPVIDSANGVIYVEAKSKQILNNNLNAPHYDHTLYKVSLSSGAIVTSTIIGDTIYSGGNYTYRTTNTGTGTDPYVIGTGDGSISVGGQNRVYFNAMRQMDRPGLTLWNGHLITAYASHGDNGPYHGWVLMFDPTTLAIQGAFNTTPNGGLGGIWQGGGILAADPQGNLYFETGNGTFDSNNGVATVNGGFQGKADYGDCFLKITLDPTSTQANQNGNPNGWGLTLVDYFSPFNNAALDSGDTDLGSGAPTVLPDSAGNATHQHLLVGAGKEGKLYLIDRDNMGKFDPATDHVVQTVGGALSGSLNTPAYFNGRLIYFPGYSGQGKSYSLTNAAINTATGVQLTPDSIGYLDGTPSVSANGTLNGVVWVIDRGSNQLRAYSAANLATELWTSATAANNRDQLGSVVKFTVPTVADGLVMCGTADHIVVYGPPVPPQSAPADPSNAQANAIAFNHVVVTWTDLSNNEDSFLIERSTDNSTWTQVGTAGANATSFDDTTTLATTMYYYRVRAHNTFNTNSYSNYAVAPPVTTPQAPPMGNGDGLAANYFLDAPHLNGTPALTRTDPTIDFDWGAGSPDPAIGVDHFSVRWTGNVKPTTTQTYTFHTNTDDGVRLWVNNTLLIDNWTDHAPTDNTATMNLVANTTYAIKMEYYENAGGAVAKLHWSTSTIADTAIPFLNGGATGNYFNDSTTGHLSGTPVLTRVETTVDSNLNWDANGSPGPAVGATNFSARWTGKVQAQYSQTYTFHTISDDGVRLSVNGVQIINDWTDHAPTDDYGTIALSAGQKYTIQLEFYQGGGGDEMRLFWSSPSTPEQTIPQSQLYSGVAPAAPTNLAVTAASGTELDLTWQDHSNIETGYSVERSTDGTNFTPILPSLPPDTTSYMDTSLNPNVTYWYRVQALNFAANSPYSNTVSLITPVPPNKPTNAHPTSVTTTAISMAWTDTSNNEDGFRVSRIKDGGTTIVIAQLPPNTTTYADSNLTPGSHYEYHIQAFNVAGYNDFTGFNTDTIATQPTALGATGQPGQVSLSWTPPAGLANFTYNVYRGTTAGGESLTPLVTGLMSAAYTDTAVTPGVTYFYKVTALDAGGESARSTEASAAPLVAAPTVVGRWIYYNNSSFDGNDPGAGPADDGAIATDKSALLPGQSSSFANYTSYSSGINGIMIDVANLPAGTGPTAADFSFIVGNDTNPAAWATPAPAPASISVRRGSGTGGSDRVTITWGDGTITNEWLKVTVNATAATGLTSPDVFYFGNLMGEANGNGQVTVADIAMTKSQSGQSGLDPTSPTDFNRSGFVSVADIALCKSNSGAILAQISAPTPAPSPAPALAAATPAAAAPSATSIAANTHRRSPFSVLPLRAPQWWSRHKRSSLLN